MNSLFFTSSLMFCVLRPPVEGRLVLDFPDYCLEKFRCGRLLHLMCKCAWKRESRLCGKILIETHPKLRQDIFHRVNSFRQILAMGGIPEFPEGASNMRQVSWDYELEKMAEAWTLKYIDRLLVQNDFTKPCTKTEEFRDGTGIVGYVLGPDEQPRDTVAIWTMKAIPPDIIGNFRPDPSNGSDSYDKYASIVWAETYKMGCSIATCDRSLQAKSITLVVCLFGPEGNTLGKPVFQNGTACSNCPPGTKCKTKSIWSKVCSSKEDHDIMDGPNEPEFPIAKFTAFLLPLASIVSLIIVILKSHSTENKIISSPKVRDTDDVQEPNGSSQLQNIHTEYRS